MQNAVFFLGANAPDGFCSLFGELQRPPVTRFHILKGGPGNGKSTYLRAVADAAEAAGMATERILCASDPDSLDGLYLPQTGWAWVDGTSPHVAEPRLPGARDIYVNLGALWDADRLTEEAERLEALFTVHAAMQGRAARYIRAAGAIREAVGTLPERVFSEKLAKRAAGIALREFGRGAGTRGTLHRRFLAAITPRGPVCLYETAFALCEKVYVLEDPMGIAAPMLEILQEAALNAGFDVWACLHPLAPGTLHHLLVPEAGTAFVSSDLIFRCPREGARHIHMDTLMERGPTLRRKLREHRRLLKSLLAAACGTLREAKALHDEIEEVYASGVDFDALHRAASGAAAEALRKKPDLLDKCPGL